MKESANRGASAEAARDAESGSEERAMRTKKRPSVRGLRDIRTHSGRVDSAGVPYMQYMKISALEMEKARRETEKFSSEERIRNIDTRLAEIEAEKGALLVELGERTDAACSKRSGGKSADDSDERPQGFRIKY